MCGRQLKSCAVPPGLNLSHKERLRAGAHSFAERPGPRQGSTPCSDLLPLRERERERERERYAPRKKGKKQRERERV